MTLWQDRVETSDALAAAREAIAWMDAGATFSSEEQDHLDRQRRIAEVVEWVLTNTDPLLIPSESLTNLASHLRQGLQYMASWSGDPNPAYLTTHATNQFDLALVDLGAIPVPTTVAEATSEIASLRRSVGQHRGQVDREIEALEQASEEVRSSGDRVVEEANAKVGELKGEIEALGLELTQLTTTVRDLANQQQGAFLSAQTEQQSAFLSAQTEQQSAFLSAQTERQETFSKVLKEKGDETSAAVEAMREKVSAEIEGVRKSSEADLAAVAEAKARVEEILGIVGEEALVGTYSKNAADERDAANSWRWIAVLAIALTVGVGVWLVTSAHTDGTDWDLFIAKLLLAPPIGGVAAYAARQSSEHRRTQREAEHVALQLAALKPYLSDLDQTSDRDKLLVEIAGRLFGHPRRALDSDSGLADMLAESPGAFAQLLQLLQAAGKDNR